MSAQANDHGPAHDHSGHSHGHGHAHGHDFAAQNQKHFDATAKEYDARPDVQELARRVREALLKKFPSLFNEDTTSVMDYACGTGALARELCPYVKSIVGVDISQGMVDQFNARVANQGLSPEDMRAECIELKGTDGELDGQKFDAITCSAAYHHFASIGDTTKLLASFLKPGGSLLVTDILQDEAQSEDITPERFGHIVPHRKGFSERDMREAFEGAGLAEFAFAPATKAKVHGREVTFFLARGVKA